MKPESAPCALELPRAFRPVRSRNLSATLLVASKTSTVRKEFLITLSRDAVTAAGLARIAAHFLRVTDDRQAPDCGRRPRSIVTRIPSPLGDPKCQRRLSVLDRRQTTAVA